MNEEEILEILKDFITNEGTVYVYDWNGFNHETILPAIQGLLDLYKKQQKEIEELKEKYSKKLIEFQKEREWYEKNHISKDKIKEKIKEVENREENYTFDKLTSEDIRRTIITNLEELLGE